VKTQTRFIHGEVDQRVPCEEGKPTYFALKWWETCLKP
jgi:hypothetical protein